MPAPGHPVDKRTTIPQATAKGATMAITLTALAIFTAGAIAGGYLLIIIGIRNEERRRSMLHRRAPGPSSRAARPVTGLWARQQIDSGLAPGSREDQKV
jgi:hypothetical protein